MSRTQHKLIIGECSQKENLENSSIRSNNKSGVIGVHYSKKYSKWVAQIRIENKAKHIGQSDNFKEAVRLRLLAEKSILVIFPRKHIFLKNMELNKRQ